MTEAAIVPSIGTIFKGNTDISSFDELQYFTNLRSLPASAFYGCSNLSSIKVPSSLTYIGCNAFYHTAWLNNQPDGPIYIGKVLYSYSGVMPDNTEIIVDDGTTCICDSAFSNCYGLKAIVLPESLTRIGEYAFSGCRGLSAINVPAGVKEIERYSFFNSGLSSVELPNNLESIGNSSFRSCTALQSIIIPDRVTNIGKNTFRGCAQLKSVTMPCYLKAVATDAFRDCPQLQAVYISNLGGWCNVDFEDYRANPLYNAHHLYLDNNIVTDVTIPDSYKKSSSPYSYYWYDKLTTIKPLVFYGCTDIKTVFIPDNILSIGNNAFYGCKNISAVKKEGEPIDLPTNAFQTRNKLYVQAEYKDTYDVTTAWNTFKQIKAYPDTDVNEDGESDVVDVVDIARYVVGTPSDAFVFFLADFNGDYQVNVADAVIEINNVANNKSLARAPEFDNELSDDILSLVKNRDCSFSFCMQNERYYSAFQFDLSFDTNANLNSLMLNNKRKNGHQIISNKIKDGLYRVVVLSMSNNTFNETNGELLNMQFDGFLNDDILISNIHFITPDGTDYAFDSLNVVHGATDIIDVNKTSNSDNSIYNLQGQKLETVSKGINIVNGKKVVVK